jgi:hypothetical protein
LTSLFFRGSLPPNSKPPEPLSKQQWLEEYDAWKNRQKPDLAKAFKENELPGRQYEDQAQKETNAAQLEALAKLSQKQSSPPAYLYKDVYISIVELDKGKVAILLVEQKIDLRAALQRQISLEKQKSGTPLDLYVFGFTPSPDPRLQTFDIIFKGQSPIVTQYSPKGVSGIYGKDIKNFQIANSERLKLQGDEALQPMLDRVVFFESLLITTQTAKFGIMFTPVGAVVFGVWDGTEAALDGRPGAAAFNYSMAGLGGFGMIGKLGKAGSIGEAALVAPNNAAHNAARYAELQNFLRAEMQRPHVVDPMLSGYMSELYRAGAQVGSGSTAAAVRVELATGGTVGGVTHSQKARDMIVALRRWLANNPTARPGDRAAAENVIIDLINSLAGR